jgi:hypothetical protein
MSQPFRTIALAALLTTTAAADVFACACCSEAGQRYENTAKIDTYASSELALLRFSPTAKLVTDAGFPESVKGIAAPSEKPYAVQAAPISRSVDLKLSGPGTGAIAMRLPKKMTEFKADPRNGAKSAGNGPDLQKEWRFEGPVRLSGAVAAGARRGTGKLVLHGHGNNCWSATDITHWTLTVTGRKTNFSLIGKFAAPAEEKPEAAKKKS